MIFYLCNGTTLAGTQAEARAIDKDFVPLDVPIGPKEAVMAFVQDLYDRIHLDVEPEPDWKPVPPPPPPPPAPISNAGAFEEEWEGFPLAKQLHFAALACENARTAIRPPKPD